MKVALFFVLLVAAIYGWRFFSKRQKKEVVKTGRGLVIPFVIAGVVVTALVFFSLNFNGKLI